jgi:hypothetical protein
MRRLPVRVSDQDVCFQYWLRLGENLRCERNLVLLSRLRLLPCLKEELPFSFTLLKLLLHHINLR